MNTAALKHRPDSEDCYLVGPDRVEVRFRTAKGNVAQVNLLYGDPYLTENDAAGRLGWAYQSRAMVHAATGATDDHWTVAVTVPYRRLQYLFQVVGVDGTMLLATDRGLQADTPINRQGDGFRLPYLHPIDAACPPAWAASTLARLPQADPAAVLGLQVTAAEETQWQAIIDQMYDPEDEALGIFVQHDTLLDKDLRPASTIPAAERPINQHWSWDRILRSPFTKQADLLQGLYFLNDQFTFAQKQRNFDFHGPLTVHESSLSPAVHAILAAELGRPAKAVELYQRTARLDLDNYNADAADGLHITAMTGAWLTSVQGFAGMRYDHDQLRFDPFLPPGWQAYRFQLNYRGRLVAVVVGASVRVSLLAGAPLDVMVSGDMQHLIKEEADA